MMLLVFLSGVLLGVVIGWLVCGYWIFGEFDKWFKELERRNEVRQL